MSQNNDTISKEEVWRYLKEFNKFMNLYTNINKSIGKQFELVPCDVDVIVCININNTINTINRISSTLPYSKSMISTAVKNLEKKGFVEKVPSKEDARSYSIQITDAATPLLHKIEEEIGQKAIPMFRNIQLLD